MNSKWRILFCVYFLYLVLNGRDAKVNKRISSFILNISGILIVRQNLLCLKECVTVGMSIQLIEKNDTEGFISMILFFFITIQIK